MSVELKNKCHSDWIPTFLSEETEESFKLYTKKLKDTSALLGMTNEI